VLETEPQLKDTYVADGQVRLIFKHYPLPGHSRSSNAAEAAECAARQGKFWEMKDLLFEDVNEWSSSANLAGAFQGYAESLGLDGAAFRQCYDSGDAASRWQQDVALGQSAQVTGTPNFFVIRLSDSTGTRVPGFIDFAQFQQVIDQVLNAPPGQ